MLSFLLRSCNSVKYSLTATEVAILGEGVITKLDFQNSCPHSKITKIVIQEGPSEIGDHAFISCISLTEIFISSSVLKIGSAIFRNCYSLKTISIDPRNPNYCCDSLGILYTKPIKDLIRVPIIKNIIISDQVEYLTPDSFNVQDSFNFGDIVIPAKVSKIESALDSATFNSIKFESESKFIKVNGFYYSRIGTLYIPNTSTSISSNAFQCAIINKLIFESESKITEINSMAMNDFRISEISLPNSVLKIYSKAFLNSRVEKIVIGSLCSEIDISAFTGCTKLKEIEISKSNSHYSSIDGVFMNKGETEIFFIPQGKTSITIKSNVDKIGDTSLQGSGLLTDIILEGNDRWSTEGGVLYSKDFETLIAVCGGRKSISIHANVRTIDQNAAIGCSALETVEFKGTLTTIIGFNAFSSSGLKSFNLPSSVTAINARAFENTKNLISFEVPDDSALKDLGSYCFRSSAITSFKFGKDVTSFGSESFSGCTNLQSITFHPQIQLETFGWCCFLDTGIVNLVLPSSLKVIPERCFESGKSLETIDFDDNSIIEKIEIGAFRYCTNLWKVTLPDSCKSIGGGAFSTCKSLSFFENNLQMINNSAFESCESLRSFNFSSRQVKFATGVFMNCFNLVNFSVNEGNNDIVSIDGIVFTKDEKVLIAFPPGKEVAIIPSKTAEFSDNAFAWSQKLKIVAFFSESALQTIGVCAFFECKVLKTIQLPGTLRKIKNRAFYGCSSLKSVSFPVLLSSVEEEAFISCKLNNVKYCGTNSIDGVNVFESSVKVSVTDMYPSETFCSNSIIKKLSIDCEVKPQFLQTCSYHYKLMPNTFVYAILFLI